MPHLYLLDPLTHTAEPYPEKMDHDKMENYSPEIVFAWAEYKKADMDLKRVTADLATMHREGFEGDHGEHFDDEISFENYIMHLVKEEKYFKE